MKPPGDAYLKFATVFLRLALGAGFLSAVADRFGLWGAYGQPNVAWGDFARFVAYTTKLNSFVPTAMIPPTAWIATAAETLLGVLLIVGWKTREAALASGVLLSLFALTMAAAGGAFLLAGCAKFPLSVDDLVQGP